MSLNNSSITQSIGIPYQQYVTSSAGHTLVSSSTYFNDTSDNIPRYKDANDNIYDAIISSSYALTASHALNAGTGGTTVIGNPGGTPTTQLTTITIGTNDFSVGGTSGNTFPFTGDAVITGSLTVSGSGNTSIFVVDGKSFFKGQVSIGNSAGDSIDFTSRVTSNFLSNGLNSERIGTQSEPWFGATITSITSSIVSLNESESLSIKNNTLEIGKSANFTGYTYGSTTTNLQTHTFSGDVNISSGKSLSVAKDIISNSPTGKISGSGELYYSSSLNSNTNLKTVVVDTATGKLFHTGSYSSGGSGPSTGLSAETKIFVWYQGMT